MKWPFGKAFGGAIEDEDIDVDGYMKELTMGTGKLPDEDEYTYLKSIRISNESDVERITKELKKGNLVMMNVGGLFSDKAKMRVIIEKVKEITKEMKGDLCKVSREKLLLVPEGMEIVG